MATFAPNIPEDTWDNLDFDDTLAFVARRWRANCGLYRDSLSTHDCQQLDQWPNDQRLRNHLREKHKAALGISQQLKYDELLQFVRTYNTFDRGFVQAVNRPDMNTCFVFGALGLVVELCSGSDSRLARVLEVLSKAKRQFELFNRCNLAYKEETDMANNMVLALEKFANMLVDVVKYIHEHPRRAHLSQTTSAAADPTEAVDSSAWPPFRRDKIEPAIEAMGENVSHIHSIAAFTTLRNDRQTAYVAQKVAGALQMNQYSHFPCISVPLLRNEQFYGRESVLQRIQQWLDWKKNPDQTTTRTFTIYGRRGIGKTHIALEYAYRNDKNFDAIFWIQCETAAALRKSFTDMALGLRLPEAIQGGPHEDNLRLCHDWLRKTDKRWLLIFDNAENINLLEPYWPASSGAILITSRSWVNFNFDSKRKGATVDIFDATERWEVLCRLLGRDVARIDVELSRDDLDATKALLAERPGFGLGLALSLTASLIRDCQARGAPIRGLLSDFRAHLEKVPDRLPHKKTLNTSHTVDTLYSVAFATLSPNAQTLLNVLCLLSPDITQEAIFNPKNQAVLSPMLEFCKQDVRKLATLSPQLQAAIKELRDAGLVRREGRILSVHRVVQEAFYYLHAEGEERQAAFNAAVRLIEEAFPRQVQGRPLHTAWERCESNIQEVLFLRRKYEDFRNAGRPVTAPPEFGELLKNAAWYLFEVGEHRESQQLLKTAFRVCDDQESLLYAHLRNTAGVVEFELNNLPLCRESLEVALRIRRKLLPSDDEEVANTINNMGNLASAEGDYETAMRNFEEAEDIRSRLGEDSAIPLSITYLGMGRAMFLQQAYKEALKQYDKAENLAVQYAGRNSVVLANIKYAIGNLKLAKGDERDAKRCYDEALGILVRLTPMHILTSSAFYKLGCCEAQLGGTEPAQRNLERAFEIGNFRRTGIDDGNIARILWKQAEVMSDSPLDTHYRHREKGEKRVQAQLMRATVEKNIGARIDASEPDEVAFDKLVCGYWR